jgi:hypothetical protein
MLLVVSLISLYAKCRAVNRFESDVNLFLQLQTFKHHK